MSIHTNGAHGACLLLLAGTVRLLEGRLFCSGHVRMYADVCGGGLKWHTPKSCKDRSFWIGKPLVLGSKSQLLKRANHLLAAHAIHPKSVVYIRLTPLLLMNLIAKSRKTCKETIRNIWIWIRLFEYWWPRIAYDNLHQLCFCFHWRSSQAPDEAMEQRGLGEETSSYTSFGYHWGTRVLTRSQIWSWWILMKDGFISEFLDSWWVRGSKSPQLADVWWAKVINVVFGEDLRIFRLVMSEGVKVPKVGWCLGCLGLWNRAALKLWRNQRFSQPFGLSEVVDFRFLNWP